MRENVKFRGGHFPTWINQTFGGRACVLSIEVKKIFMDEWTGEVDALLCDAVGRAIESTVPGVLEELKRL